MLNMGRLFFLEGTAGPSPRLLMKVAKEWGWFSGKEWETLDYLTSEELKSLIKVALGREEADLFLGNGKLVNVFSGAANVAGKGKWIAYVGSRNPAAEKRPWSLTPLLFACCQVISNPILIQCGFLTLTP